MIEFQKVYDIFTDVGMSDPLYYIPYINPTTNEAEYLPVPDSEAEDGFEDLEEMRERICNDPNWIELPTKRELNLGSRLPLRFAEECLESADCDLIYNFFRHSGAYSNFRALLDRLDKTQEWYQYEDNAIREALKQWLADNDIEFSG